ncbi:MAG: large repetitive protein, partial [Thermoleophilaceae bacterium]|nr:large repetitive protein [Thermoleophilaceae bacterium]
PASTSAYHLVGTNGSGQVLADVPMVEAAMHVDGEQPPVPLVGVIPSAGVESVVIVKDGATLAGRARSAHPPTIAIKGKPAVSKGKATVRWSSGDADGNPREATVDYSSDGGKSFRRIFIGPDKHSARVPARYLSRSSNARVRVTVNDGFQATSATSAGFRAPGAPPEVSILSPASGYHQPNDAALVLSGQAFDDSGKMLAGKQLSWRMGHRVLGSGDSIAASGLPSGRRQITLVARDHLGRTGRRSIAVVINGARPIFLTLKAPGSVTSKARSLRLKVSTSLPARLLVRGSKVPAQGFSVGRKARTVSVPVARGAGRLTLRLRLTSGGKSSSRTVLIRRK